MTIAYRITFHFSFPVVLLGTVLLLGFNVAKASEPLVNINLAEVEELADKLTGIGPAKAKAIVEYRKLNGPYKTVDELTNVKGIGERTLEKIRSQLVVTINNHLMHEHNRVAPIASAHARSKAKVEQRTRHAVRSVIEAARRDSTALRF